MAYSKESTQYKIFSEADDLKTAYETGVLEKMSGLARSQYQVIRMCEYYSDSKYLGSYLGNKKEIAGGSIDVPFNNIVNFRVTLAKTATDIDIKDHVLSSDDPKHQVQSMILNREGYEWMKSSGYAKSLNDMGLTRPKYGGYLVKKDETNDDMKISVVRWTNVCTDQNDILSAPIIEEHHMSPMKLNRKKSVWNNVNEVLKAFKAIKVKERPNSITVHEITGEFPISIFNDAEGLPNDKEDDFTFTLQHYFVANVNGKKFLMFCEELSGEMDDYYEYLTWEDNGYALGRGVIEDSEEAQVWTNDAVIEEHMAMQLAGRVGIKTTSKKVQGNVLAHDHGKIYELENGTDMNAFNLAPSALGQYQNIINRWKAQADNVTSAYDAVTGEQPPSGTPLGTTQLLNAVASKPFDYKREEWGIHLTKIWEKWVIPYLIKKVNKEHILVSDYTDTELELIDESFAQYNALIEIVDEVLKGGVVSRETQVSMEEAFKKHIKKQGKKRFIEVPEGYFDGVIAKMTVNITGEQKNKAAILQSLSELLKTVQMSYNPNTGEFGILKDPSLSKIFAEIVEIAGSGISPVSLGLRSSASPAAQVSQTPTAPVTPSPSIQSPLMNNAVAGASAGAQ